MADNTYVLDLTVTGAAMVTVNDDGSGDDAIVVHGVYNKPVEISLCWTANGGLTTTAGGFYFGAGNEGHRLVVNGLIENASGSNGQDIVQGNELANRLFGDQAATGPGGADTLFGGIGQDTVHGGAGADMVAGGADGDLLFGDAGKDAMQGDAGDDALFGGSGRDRLSGGAGRDVLTGGMGADRFVFATLGDSTVDQAQRDTIADFQSGQGDLITLNTIDANTAAVGNQVFRLIATPFQGVAGELRIEVQGNDIVVSGDVNGDAVADFAILVQNVGSLGSADFIL